ncbi:MAG: riboflavin synthase subunit alpha [Limnothrix sp.]
MINPTLLTLGIAALATFLSLSTQEEIVKVATAFVAVLAGFIALCYMPWFAKLIVISVPLLLDRINAWSVDA